MARFVGGLLASLVLIACQAIPAPVPAALEVHGHLPHGGTLSAEAEARTGDVYRTLATTTVAVDGRFSLTLPAEPPGPTLQAVSDVAHHLCPGASATTLSTSRDALSLIELHELWLRGPDRLEAVTIATRPGLHAGLGTGFASGDAFVRWTYVDHPLRVTGSCHFGGSAAGAVQLVDLDLRPGWNTVTTIVTAAVGGTPTALRLESTPPSRADWVVTRVMLPDSGVVRVPTSLHHAGGSWWGYHQNKLLRVGEDVFVSVLNDDPATDEASTLRVLHRTGQAGDWREVLALPGWRTGHLLLDDGGGMHLMTFVPDDPDDTSLGSLRSQRFLATGPTGDERVLDPDANVRFGATVLPAGRLLTVWGGRVAKEAPGFEVMHLAFGAADASPWADAVDLVVDRSFHYPYVVADGNRAVVAAVENRHDDGGNFFQRVLLWQVGLDGSAGLDQSLFLTYDHLPLAATRRVLVEVSDLLLASDGSVHVIIKEFLDPHAPRRVSRWRYLVKEDAAATWRDPSVVGDERGPGGIDTHGLDCSWLRLTEVPPAGHLVAICSTFDGLAAIGVLQGSPRWIRVPPSSRGHQPHLAAPRSGSAADLASLDVLLLPAWAGAYPGAGSFLVHLDRASLSAALQTVHDP